jgi:hypothetical protein
MAGEAKGRLRFTKNSVDRLPFAEFGQGWYLDKSLRRTFLTIAESLEIPYYALKALVNHSSAGDVTARYIQVSPERLRGPMQKITDFICRAIRERSGKVLQLRGA